MKDYRIDYNGTDFLYAHTFTENPQLHPRPFYMHAHNDYELLFIVKGNLHYTIEGLTFPIREGDLITIKPMSYHNLSLTAEGAYERFNIALNKVAFNTDIVNEIFKKNGKSNLLSKPFFYQWATRMDEIILNYEEPDKSTAVKLLIQELLFWLKYNMSSLQFLTNFSNNDVLSNALNYINNHLDSLQSVSELAQNVFVSEPYLFHLFKKHLNTTPKMYIMQKKMLQAERSILEGERLKTVSEKVGYSDYSVFFKSYKKYFGRPPSK